MKKIYSSIEIIFEKLTYFMSKILGSSVTFAFAFSMIVFWFLNRSYHNFDINEIIRDFLHGFTFLSLFVIQKEFSKFSGSLHLKVNELVATTDSASNTLLNVESKTEDEINTLQKEYALLADKIENQADTEEKSEV